MKYILLGLILSIVANAPAFAQAVPSGMTYQGRLTDASGNPSPDGTGYEIEVRLWNSSAGGTLLWGTRYTGVPLKNGAFNLILGSGGTAISGASTTDLKNAFNNVPIYIGITMTKNSTGAAVSSSEIVPRQQVFSTPFSFRTDKADKADDSQKLGGQPATFYSPTGSIMAFAGSTAPAGWLLCDGSAVSTTTYPALFAVIGTTYGADAAGTFKLPDLRGRFPLGTNPTPQQAVPTTRVLAQQGGEEKHTLTVAEMPAHNHNERYYAPGASSNVGLYPAGQTYASSAWRGLRADSFDQQSNVAIAPQGGDLPHNIMPPFLVLNFIIKF